ncbi:hypothetical protein A2V71_01365 [Candidatus Berkelbacteria bacterium RBG_13_40_8]|uniref:Uncharacterized protein n=1 Tax=Candidatus Berkelbacteria bacterium RBG_13_40_8 TaxID=1797467 RepID=A0A1F5DMF0_9BACT|nr:MAG: hypothetical protein A2V71_01365 [Candidatus Berkelbacteria bacterium RBG_13_40_8]
MKLEDHEARCLQLLGKPFTEIHVWLDRHQDFEKHPFVSDDHRVIHHHFEGLQQIRDEFVSWAILPALAHIMDDCLGYIPTKEEYLAGVVDRYGRPQNQKLLNPRWFENFMHWDIPK